MNNQSSSTRAAISTFVTAANCNKCMKIKTKKNLHASNCKKNVPFGVSGYEKNTNLIGDSINIHNGPRAVMVTGSGEKYILPSDEEVMEKSSQENAFYFKSKYISHAAPSKLSRIHRWKTSKNSYIHSSQKVRLNITPRVSNSVCSTHSHHSTKKSSSKSSSIGTQTPLIGNALNMPVIKRSGSSRRYPYTIAEEAPLQNFNEMSELHRGQTLPHPSEPLSTTVVKLEGEPKSSCRNIWKDIRCIFFIFSVVSVLFWVLSIYFEIRVATEFFEYIVKKIRSVYAIPEPQTTKSQIFKDFIYRMFM